MDEVLSFKQMVVWNKGPMGLGWHYRRSYETVLVAQKGKGKCRWFDKTALHYLPGKRTDRTGTEFTDRDRKIVQFAVAREGRKRRAFLCPHLGRLLGRDPAEVDRWMEETVGARPAHGLLKTPRRLRGGCDDMGYQLWRAECLSAILKKRKLILGRYEDGE